MANGRVEQDITVHSIREMMNKEAHVTWIWYVDWACQVTEKYEQIMKFITRQILFLIERKPVDHENTETKTYRIQNW